MAPNMLPLRSCALLLLAAILPNTVVAACNGGSEDACAEEGSDVALLQHRVGRSSSHAGLDEAEVSELQRLSTQRILASITKHANFRFPQNRSVRVRVNSVVPVYPPKGDPYMAFILAYTKQSWALLNHSETGLSCGSEEMPGHTSPAEAFGGELRGAGRWTTVLKCAWPRELENHRCHSVSLIHSMTNQTVGSYKTCREPELAAEGPFELAACVEPVRERSDRLPASGIMQLPQWLEYNAQKGVQHFLLYTTNDTDLRAYEAMRPFIEAKMVTQIRLEIPLVLNHGGDKTQQVVMNDCLHRMKGRAKWLMSSVDLDEYNVFNGSDTLRSMSFPDALTQVTKGADDIHAVTYSRINFMHPEEPYENLQIASPYREGRIATSCTKYFLRPDLVNALFVHWPMSWTNGTRHLYVPRKTLISHHYRVTSLETPITDTTLSSQAVTLDAALEKRYGQPWSRWAQRLRPVGLSLLEIPTVHAEPPVEEDQMDASYAEYVASLTEPTFIEDTVGRLVG